MQIISHRGYWTDPAEKNSLAAFERSLARDFGIETDVRDLGRELVISHDPPDDSAIRAADFLDLYRRMNKPHLRLALNIKADGLQAMLKSMLADYGVENFFVFDMSVPDTLQYARQGIPLYTRQSEFELAPCCYDSAAGVWLDELDRRWISEESIQGHLARGKQVCIVSPELHGRAHLPVWKEYRSYGTILSRQDWSLCTDFPDQAQEFFNA